MTASYLPKKRVLERGDPMQILCGTFKDHVALYDGMLPHERFAVLLNFMGAQGASNSIASTSVRRSSHFNVANSRQS